MKNTIIAIMLTAISCSISGQAGLLTVKAAGFRNDRGQCLVFVYSASDGFPFKPDKALIKYTGKITDRKSVFEIKDLEPGTYAVSVVHDENNNGKTDTNIIGIPTEGLGSSNNPASFGPPSFKSAEFNLDTESKTITINLKYL